MRHRVPRGLTFLLVAALLVGGLAAPAWSAVSRDTAVSGQALDPGDALVSGDGRFTLAMQLDGNLVLYGPAGAIWATGTFGRGNSTAVQPDGNVVVYASDGRPLWATGTPGHGSVRLVVQGDGNVVLLAGNGVLWASGTARGAGTSLAASGDVLATYQSLVSADGRFHLVVQGDGNVVLYAPEGPLWATGTSGSHAVLAVQLDGNLVVYAGDGRALWASGTAGDGAVRLTLGNDGDAVLTGTGGPVWSSGTTRVPAPPTGDPGSAGQVVSVVAASATATTATVSAWTRTPSGWTVAVAPTSGFVGAAGVGTASEASTRTPAGTFTLTQAFGRIANPGTRLSWFTSDTQDWWDENPASPTYNLHVRRSTSPGGASENLYLTGTAYDAAVVMDVNTARTPGAGSAFFLHVSTGAPTAGCVSVPAATVIAILRWLDPATHPVISIGVG